VQAAIGAAAPSAVVVSAAIWASAMTEASYINCAVIEVSGGTAV